MTRTLPLLLAAVALALTGCSSGTDPVEAEAVSTTQVDVADNVFEPAAIAVEPGDEVTWTWVGSNQHNVVGEGEGWSEDLMVEGTFTRTFDDPGVVEYRCTIHPGMRGVVRVGG